MNLIIELNPETEARLKEHAARHGQDVVSFAISAIEEKLSGESQAPQALAADAWNRRLDSLLSTLPQTQAAFVDDSRPNIYSAG